MTEKQFEYLKRFENNFRTSINCNYTVNVPNFELDKIKAIYEEITGNKVYMCKYCSSDILNLLKNVGQLYFKEKERVELEQTLNNNKLQDVVANLPLNERIEGTNMEQNNNKKKNKKK